MKPMPTARLGEIPAAQMRSRYAAPIRDCPRLYGRQPQRASRADCKHPATTNSIPVRGCAGVADRDCRRGNRIIGGTDSQMFSATLRDLGTSASPCRKTNASSSRSESMNEPAKAMRRKFEWPNESPNSPTLSFKSVADVLRPVLAVLSSGRRMRRRRTDRHNGLATRRDSAGSRPAAACG